ncbi:MAG: GntR family transcriptional regulator [Planctomycetota bacterium]|jgi:GntR family transcriptional regulator
MWPRPNPKSSVPVSEQIARSIRARISSGRLNEGEKLPSVRAFAAELLVNPNTVAKVYRELEREELLVARPGSGVTVAIGARERCANFLATQLEERLRSLLHEIKDAGFVGEALQELIESAQDLRIVEKIS